MAEEEREHGSGKNAGTAESKWVTLIVDNDRQASNRYASFLSDEYTVRIANTGEKALDMLTNDIDIVLVNRRLDRFSGEAFVSAIHDRKINCQIALMTSIAPLDDIAQLPIDAYLLKPITKPKIRRTLDELQLWAESDIDQQELLSLVSRRITLEDELDNSDLAANDEYASLIRRIEIAEARLDVSAERYVTSSYQPSSCPECGLSWNISVGNTLGVEKLASFVWECTQCGYIVHSYLPMGRNVARR